MDTLEVKVQHFVLESISRNNESNINPRKVFCAYGRLINILFPLQVSGNDIFLLHVSGSDLTPSSQTCMAGLVSLWPSMLLEYNFHHA